MILNEHTSNDSETSTATQPTAETQESTSPQNAASAEPQAGSSEDANDTLKESMKEMSPDDFATALENFTPSDEAEKQSHEDRVMKGTVLKLTGTHVSVDTRSISEGS